MASRCFPGHAPHYLGHARRQDLELLATLAVNLRPFEAGMVRGGRDGAAIAGGLQSCFRAMRDMASVAGSTKAPRERWVRDLRRFFEGHEARDVAAAGLARLESALPSLPSVPQHGDLVASNLGLARGPRLTIFDWDDFGRVDLPGLDLFSIEYSFGLALGAVPPLRPPTMAALDIDRCCRALGLEREHFEHLRPAYELTFRYLKRQFGPAVQASLDALIRHPVESASAASAA